MVDIQGLVIFRCLKGEDSPETLGVVDKTGMGADENATIREVSTRLVENLIGDPNIGRPRKTPKYGRGKSARIHEFSEAATVERDNGYETKAVLDSLRSADELEDHAAAVAEWYLNETQSRSDLLLVVPYEYDDHGFVAIIKTPYLEDAYETDPTEILKEAEQVIQRKTHKGLVYPHYDRHAGSIDTDQAKVYQSGGSYSDYWWGFLRLQETKVEDEELAAQVADNESPFTNVSSTSEMPSVPDEIDNSDLLDANVKVEISGIELDVELGDLTDGSTVKLAKKDNTYFVILKGGEPDIQVQNRNKQRSVFPELNDFDDLEEALAQYL